MKPVIFMVDYLLLSDHFFNKCILQNMLLRKCCNNTYWHSFIHFGIFRKTDAVICHMSCIFV